MRCNVPDGKSYSSKNSIFHNFNPYFVFLHRNNWFFFSFNQFYMDCRGIFIYTGNYFYTTVLLIRIILEPQNLVTFKKIFGIALITENLRKHKLYTCNVKWIKAQVLSKLQICDLNKKIFVRMRCHSNLPAYTSLSKNDFLEQSTVVLNARGLCNFVYPTYSSFPFLSFPFLSFYPTQRERIERFYLYMYK